MLYFSFSWSLPLLPGLVVTHPHQVVPKVEQLVRYYLKRRIVECNIHVILRNDFFVLVVLVPFQK